MTKIYENRERTEQYTSGIMQSESIIENLLDSALKRQPRRLSYESTYSHDNLRIWLKNILPYWEIVIPTFGKDQSSAALSNWPSNNIRDDVKVWLEEKNINNVNDLIDGSCEPLAFYLSSKIKTCVEKGNFRSIMTCYQSIKTELDILEPRNAAELIYESFVHQEKESPSFWGPEIVGSYKNFLFGHDLAKVRILEAVNIRNVHILPLYVLNYIFSDDELSDRELESHVVETAQYSLHVVGLIFDPERNRVIVADSNGALIPGSNMEFLSMPLKTRRASDSTRVSRYDLDCRKRGSSGVSKSSVKKRRK